MLEVCKEHQDYLVVYDYPLNRSCPVCPMQSEMDDANDKAEQIPDLKDKIGELDQELILKDLEIANLKAENFDLNDKLDEYFNDEFKEKHNT